MHYWAAEHLGDKYGRRVKVIQDKNITDSLDAEAIMLNELDIYSDPLKEIKLKLKDIYVLNPGQTCTVDIPIYDINSTIYKIVDVNYTFNKDTELNGKILDVNLSKGIPDITDSLKDIYLQIKKLQSSDITDADLLTRYKYTTGSVSIRQSGCYVYTRTMTGSSILCAWQGCDLQFVGALASGIYQKGLAPIGSPYTDYIIQWSGGFL
jgi:hypothetical protein